MYEYNENFKKTGKEDTIRMLGEISETQWAGIHPNSKGSKQEHLEYVESKQRKMTSYAHYVLYMRLKELTNGKKDGSLK